MRLQNVQKNFRITESFDNRINKLIDKLKKTDDRITFTRLVVSALEKILKREGL